MTFHKNLSGMMQKLQVVAGRTPTQKSRQQLQTKAATKVVNGPGLIRNLIRIPEFGHKSHHIGLDIAV